MPIPRRVTAVGAALLLATTAAVQVLTATPAAAAAICNKYCDGRDPALSPGDRQPLSASIFGRTITIHYDDADAMGWASIANGSPTDEVWIDRSFDGGRTWASGSKLGDTTIPSGDTGWRTLMYNVDDWNNRGVGALRACGKAGNRPDVASTGLMEFYDNGTGLFDTTGWWNSANALTAVIDNIRATGMGSYTYAIANTYALQVNSMSGNFTNAYLDDTGWWGLAWVDAYDLTGNSQYLTTARADADYMDRYWDGTCGGGIWWSTAKTAKNAIANSLFLDLNAKLHNRIAGDTTYLARANAEWTWFTGTGMINSASLINDGVNLTTCGNNGAPVWSYNQGVPLAGLVEMSRATGNQTFLTTAQRLANASTTNAALNPNGILTDPCEANSGCGADGPSFKGAYARGLAALNTALSSHPYTSYLARQANSAYAGDRTALDTYGLHWAGPVDSTDAARQQSAVDLLNTSP